MDARVQGSRPTPYRVTIRFRRLTEADWAAVADAMAAEALYAAIRPPVSARLARMRSG